MGCRLRQPALRSGCDVAQLRVPVLGKELEFDVGWPHWIDHLSSGGRTIGSRWRSGRWCLDRSVRSVAAGSGCNRQYGSGHQRLLQATHDRNPLPQRARRPCHLHLDAHRARRRHPGLHLDPDRQPLPGRPPRGRQNRNVLRKPRRPRRHCRPLPGSRRHVSGDARSGPLHREEVGRPFAIPYEVVSTTSRSPILAISTCTVIKALGDKFDFLAYYSDFRIDNQEAGTPSNGPLGGGLGGGHRHRRRTSANLAGYCSEGRFQWQYIQPVYVGANQMQEYPPAGIADHERPQHRVLHAPARRASAGRQDAPLQLRDVADRARDGSSLGRVRLRAT